MGNQHHNHTQQSFSTSLWKVASSLTLGALSTLSLVTPAQAEGSFQINTNSDSIQRLYDYDSRVNLGGTTFFEPFDRPLYVDVLNDNEIINVLACVDSSTDIQVEIFKVNSLGVEPNIIAGDSLSGAVVSTTLTGGNIGNGCDENTDITDAATVIAPDPDNNNQGIVTYAVDPSGGGLGTGTYRIQLTRTDGDGLVNTIAEAATNFTETIRLFDVTISTTATPIPNPAIDQGRLWSYNWGFNAGGFVDNNTTDQNYYIVTPSNLSVNPFIWLLDMEEVAGFVYEIMANEQGVDSPNVVGRDVAGLSVPYSETNNATNLQNGVTPQFRQYLSRPEAFPGQPAIAPIVADNFRFEDAAGEDNTISPGITGGVQDTGIFRFTTNDPGTYVIIVDIDDDGDETNGFNPDGVFGVGDVFLRGETVNGELSVPWDGTSSLGNTLPTGVYPAKLQAITGEYHFVATDMEHSGPTGGGITIFDGSGATPTPTNVFWDDRTGLQFDLVNLNKCAPLPADANCSSLPLGFPSDGTRHRWGSGPTDGGFVNTNAASAQFGNLRFLDTYVYGQVDAAETPAVIISDTSTLDPDGPRQDYGDAPDTYSTDKVQGNDGVTNGDALGASHTLPLGTAVLFLGDDGPDGELDAQIVAPNETNALGDDRDGTGTDTPADDDEDGVASFPTLTADLTTYSVDVEVFNNNAGADAYLVGWIDYNRNGTFEASEGVRQVVPASGTAQTVTLTWTGLTGLVQGDTYARFRLSSEDRLTTEQFFGTYLDGEVEDYALTIEAPVSIDYGDAPDTTAGNGENDYTTTAANGGPFHTVDAALKLGANEGDSDDGTLQNASATADDLSDTDGDGTANENDEDGLTSLPNLALNATSYTATVNVTNTTGSDAYLVAWIDFDESGTFDTDEGILYDADAVTPGIQAIATGTNNTDVTVTWANVAALRPGATFNADDNIFARFRLTDTVLTDADGTQSIGALGMGEVEDYQLTLAGQAELLLVKRITAVRRGGAILGTGDRLGGDDTSIFNDDSGNLNDNDVNWPDTSIYLTGALVGGQINPGDEVEYTIYFLNSGSADANNLTLCDVIPDNMTYVTSSMELFLDNATPLADPIRPDAGVLLGALGTAPDTVTDEPNDGDRGAYFPPGVSPSPTGLCQRGGNPLDDVTNPNVTGAVIFNVVDNTTTPSNIAPATSAGEPANSYGFIRFRATTE